MEFQEDRSPVSANSPGTVVRLVAAGVSAGVNVGVAQIPLVMVLESSVTAPSRAINCPCTNAPVFAVIDAIAKICPTKREFVPKVTELQTSQKIRQ